MKKIDTASEARIEAAVAGLRAAFAQAPPEVSQALEILSEGFGRAIAAGARVETPAG